MAAQLLLHGRVGEYAANLVRYRLRIGGVEHGVVIADHFGDAGVVGADDGAAASHRFQCRQAEALVQGREDEQARAAIQVDQRVVVDIAGKQQLVGSEAAIFAVLLQAVALPAIEFAGDQQLCSPRTAGASRE